MSAFEAKYAGPCAAGDRIEPGDQVVYVNDELVHVDCEGTVLDSVIRVPGDYKPIVVKPDSVVAEAPDGSMVTFGVRGVVVSGEVSGEDREKAIALVRDDPSPSANVDALIADGWRPPRAGEFDGDTSAAALAAWARYQVLPVNHEGFEHVEQDAFTAGFDAARRGGAPARPTREALAQVITAKVYSIHGPDSTDEDSAALDGQDIADALLAADHLWAEQPAGPAIGCGHVGCTIAAIHGHVKVDVVGGEVAGVMQHPSAPDVMGEFEPTTAEVRAAFIQGSDEEGSGGDFDLWLARHDAAIRTAHPSAPVVDGEALARVLYSMHPYSPSGPDVQRARTWEELHPKRIEGLIAQAATIISSGLFVDRATVEAEQREKDAQIVERSAKVDGRARIAAAIRAGGAS